MKTEQLVDLHEVEAYWKSRGLVDEKHLPYYIRWVQRFWPVTALLRLRSRPPTPRR